MSITAFNNKLQDLVKTEERELDGTGLQPPTIDSFDGAGQLVKRVGNFGSTDPAPQTNYFIHSSVLGKLVSEADETGRKLKTFVPANGVTLAQQQVIYYQGTTERLTFVHQDASTTGTQETNDDGTLVNVSNRSGEYDPLGRNIASAGPYISLDTNPQSGDGVSGINMFGSGEGYRPGQQSYRIDHLAVPASLFMEEINTGRFGGAFGLLEMAARMSTVEIEWQRTWEWQTTSTASDGTVRVNTHSLTLTMEVFQIQNWAVNLSIPQAQTRLDFPEPKTKGTVSDEQRKRLTLAYDRLKQILQNKKCLDFLGGYDKVKTLLKNTRISFADDLGQVRFGDGHPMIAHNQGAIGAMTDGKTIRLNAYGSFMAVNRQVPAQIGGMATLAATEISNNRSMDFQSDVSRAAFVLLHELGHRAGVLETDGYPADLEKERQAQERNNTKLFENCYAQGESK